MRNLSNKLNIILYTKTSDIYTIWNNRYILIQQREIVLSSADSLLKQRFKNDTAVGAGRV